jgi:hypothetical protein
LYRLKQASRAWYARLKIFLLDHEYMMVRNQVVSTLP